MLFVAIGWDSPGSRQKRPSVRDQHLAYWKDWDDAGRVILAGQLTDFSGSLFVLEASNLNEVEIKLRRDPYVTSGVFSRTEIHPFRAALPAKTYGQS